MLLDDIPAEQFFHVFKAFLQFADLIVGKWPIAAASGIPELDMAHLLQRHDLAETGLIRLLGRLWLGRCPRASAANPTNTVAAITAVTIGFIGFSATLLAR